MKGAGRGHRRRLAGAAVAAVALGLGLRVAVTSESSRYLPDAYSNLLIAGSFLDGHPYNVATQHPPETRSPAYPLAIAAVASAGPSVEEAARWVTLIAAALVVLPLGALARRVGGRRAAYAAYALGATSCLAAVAESDLPEPQYILVILAAASTAWSASRTLALRVAAAAGLLAGLAALTRPEGIVWLGLFPGWIALGAPRRAGGWTRRAGAAGVFALAALAIFGPYVAWVSGRLGRFEPAPGVTFLRDIRYVSDHFGLREGATPPRDWAERARFMTDTAHERVVLETWFRSRTLLPPDERFVAAGPATAGPDGASDLADVLRRRRNILLGNLFSVPGAVWREHLVPAAVVVLAALGAVAAALTTRKRHGGLFMATAVVACLVPVASHIEGRFLYAPFAFALVFAAVGWAAIDDRLRTSMRLRQPLARGAIHAALLAAVAYGLFLHPMRGRSALAALAAQRELGTELDRALPPSPVLAVRPGVPYWARRPYAPLPVGRPEDVLAFAQSLGASAVVLELPSDASRRPEMMSLVTGPAPPGFEPWLARRAADGSELRVFRVEAGLR